MDGEWNEVKAKPKKKKAPAAQAESAPVFGGKGKKGKLIAGPVQDGFTQQKTGYEKGGGYDDYADTGAASGLVDFYDDQEVDYEEEQKVEMISHTCAQAV